MNLDFNIYRDGVGEVILFATIPAFLIYLSPLLNYILYK